MTLTCSKVGFNNVKLTCPLLTYPLNGNEHGQLRLGNRLGNRQRSLGRLNDRAPFKNSNLIN